MSATLTLAGTLDDDESLVYRDLTSLEFTESTSSMGSWRGVLPYRVPLEDELLSECYIYNDGELLFAGQLETYEVDYETGETELSGRGVLAELDRSTDSATYSNTTVYEALIDVWTASPFEASIRPPNDDLADERAVTNYDFRRLWGASTDTRTIEDDEVYAERNRLVVGSRPTVDVYDNDLNQYPTVTLDSESSDRLVLFIETRTPYSTLEAGLKQMDDDDNEIETVWQKNQYNEPQRFHYFDLQFANANYYYRPVLERPDGQDLPDDNQFEVIQSNVIAPDWSKASTLDDVELNGTTYDIIKRLHEIGGYNFTIREYDTLTVDSFPIGTTRSEPNWRVITSTRSLDLQGYANSVTVQGGRDGGDPPTATKSSQYEIDIFGEIERYEKNPELTTQSEVDDRAERLLREAIAERDEAGSLEVTSQRIIPGYNYPVSGWDGIFESRTQIGSNALYFDGTENRIQFQVRRFGATNSDQQLWEFWLYPEGLDVLDDDEFYTIIEYDHYRDIDQGFVRIYGDGSVEVGINTDWGRETHRSDPRIIKNNLAQRLSVFWGDDVDTGYVFVNGESRFIFENNGRPKYEPFDNFDYYWYIGDYSARRETDPDDGVPYKGGLSDVRLWIGSDPGHSPLPNDGIPQSWIIDYYDRDLVDANIFFDNLPVYFRFNEKPDSDGEIINDGTYNEFNTLFQKADYLDAPTGELEEVSYSLGSGESIDLDFNVTRRVETELKRIERLNRSTRSVL